MLSAATPTQGRRSLAKRSRHDADLMANQIARTRADLARTTLSVLFIGALLAGSLWILAPFLGAFVWATMIAVATWPLLLRVERAFAGRRAPAVALMTLAMLAVLVAPLLVGINAVVAQADTLAAFVEKLPDLTLPAAPDWLGRLPMVGDRVEAAWNQFAGAGWAELSPRAEPYVRDVAAWLAERAGGVAMVVLQFILVVILTAVLYAGGEAWAAWTRRFGRRLADEQGERMVVLAGAAIRGVAMGVVVTALVQTLLGGLGLVIAGVPFAGVLAAIMFVFCIAQIGPMLVLLGATAWAYYTIGPGWGTFLLAWSLVVGLLDNFIRPAMIRRGADLPLLLIFAGVIGGLLAFGIVGIFVGPVILAVTYTLLDDWVAVRPASAPPVSSESPAP
jgi:predicted PurR-regulated permease PerM